MSMKGSSLGLMPCSCPTPMICDASEQPEAKKTPLEEQLADLSSAGPEITPNLADLYRGAGGCAYGDVVGSRRRPSRLSELIARFTIRYDYKLSHTA